MSRIYGLEALVAKGKITEKQEENIMIEFIDMASKLEKEEGIRIYDAVTEENLEEYLKKI
ncbi:hypothetical protein [Methanobacterium sp. MBAC-LM]|uniref:hypothetical protein n=1 Tax=Methanobacterium sp. MBAC-LM TaxID=3412034 RepID=UPI003C7877F4